MDDLEIISGLVDDPQRRQIVEKELYSKFVYFINEGINHYNLNYEDSFSAYSDAILTLIHNVKNRIFSQKSSIKTYLHKIYSNKCIDLIRKNSTVKDKVNQSVSKPELLDQIPDKVRSVIENLIQDQRITAIRKNIQEIGDKCKQILMLFQDDYSDKEIADLLGYNSASVAKVTRLRCMQKIKEKMKNFISHE
ncbi:RNA polymerase sigma factor [Flavitalea sp.]|nr:sigma-70 family RNA polymerase sigma factor [Flavitalea sp.]